MVMLNVIFNAFRVEHSLWFSFHKIVLTLFAAYKRLPEQ